MSKTILNLKNPLKTNGRKNSDRKIVLLQKMECWDIDKKIKQNQEVKGKREKIISDK